MDVLFLRKKARDENTSSVKVLSSKERTAPKSTKINLTSASSSAVTGSCITTVGVVCLNQGAKRKVDDAEEGPSKKRRLVTEDVKEEPTIKSQEKTKPREEAASVTGSCITTVGVVCLNQGAKRKVDDAEDGPSRKRRLVTEDVKEEPTIKSQEKTKPREEAASVTGSCITTVEVVGQNQGAKRKVDDAEEGPSRKRRLVTEDVEDIKEKPTKQQEFEAKYKELDHIDHGRFGTVFAGYRRADHRPVAIKHILNEDVWLTHKDTNGNTISIEVAILLKLSAESKGTSPSLLDWYQLERELVLVMERPIYAKSFRSYLRAEGLSMTEEEVKIILRQLVDVALNLKSKGIFHRDIKTDNMLIETCSIVPRVLLIDFGMSCYDEGSQRHSEYFGSVPPPEVYGECGYTAEPTTVFQIGTVLFDALHEEKNVFNTPKFFMGGQSLPKEMSTDCYDFLKKCLRKYPATRPTLEQLRNHQWLR